MLIILQQSSPESGVGSPRSLEDDDDDDDDKDVKEKELQTEAIICAFETLGKGWPRKPETQSKFILTRDKTEPQICFDILYMAFKEMGM